MKVDKKIEYGKISAFLGLLFLLAAWVFYRITVPGSILHFVLLGFGVLFVVGFFVLGYPLVKKSFSNRAVRRGLFSFLTTVFILAFLVTLYILAGTKFKYSTDMTQDKVFELSLQSVEVVKKLNFPLRISVFDKEENLAGGGQASLLPTLLRFYKQESNNIDIRYIDPVKNPALFRNYNLNGAGDIGSLVFNKLVLPKSISPTGMDNILSSLSDDKSRLLLSVYDKSGNYVIKEELSSNLREEIISIFDSAAYRYDQPVTLPRRELFRGKDYQPEAKITSAIASLIETNEYFLYVSTGHGEKSFDKEYSNLKDMLSLENYTVREADLTKKIPSDASLVFIAGPQRAFNSLEIDNLMEYSDRGGSLFILLDPVFQHSKISVSNPLKDLFSVWGVKTDSSFVFDYSNIRQIQVRVGNLGGLSIAQRRLVHLGNYTDHSIVSPLKLGNIRTFFYGLRPLYSDDDGNNNGGKEGAKVEAKGDNKKEYKKRADIKREDILVTSEDAFLKRDETDQKAHNFNSKTDKKASYKTGLALVRPITLSSPEDVSTGKDDAKSSAKAKDKTEGKSKDKGADDKSDSKDTGGNTKESRLIIIGDSDFINNEYSAGDNGVDLFMNSIAWLSKRGKQITIRPKERKRRDITITSQDKNIVFYFSVLLLPFSVIGLGIYVYTRRKKG